MSDTAAVIDAPPATDAMPDAGAIFDQIQKSGAISAVQPEQTEPQDDPQPAKPEKTEKAPAKETTAPAKKPSKDDIPDELLTGKPAEPEAKPDAAKDPFAYDPPASASEKTKVHWAAAKQVNGELKSEVEKLRTELETVRKAPKQADETTVAELKALREEREQLAKKLEIADFTQSPRFQSLVAKEKSLLSNAAKYLKGKEIPENIIEVAAHASDATRAKILEDAGIEGNLLTLIAPYLAQYDGLQDEKQDLLANHKTIREEEQIREKTEREQREAQILKEEEAIFEKVGKDVSKRFTPLQKLPGEKYAEWNEGVEERLALAKQFFSGEMTTEAMAEIAYAGVSYRAMQTAYDALRERYKASEEMVKKLSAGQPGVGRQLANGENGTIANDASGNLDQQRAREFEMAARNSGHQL